MWRDRVPVPDGMSELEGVGAVQVSIVRYLRMVYLQLRSDRESPAFISAGRRARVTIIGSRTRCGAVSFCVEFLMVSVH